MDLTIKFEDRNEVLNIRVAIIMQTKKGFVFSHRKSGNYYFAIGGRCKLGDSSVASAVRETEEETGLKLKEEDFKLISIIENFWSSEVEGKTWKTHEINFVYSVPMQEQVFEAVDSAEVVEIPREQLADLDIRPNMIKKLILGGKLNEFNHFVV